MYDNNDIIGYLQTNKILAIKLEHALTGVGKAVSNQAETIAKGTQRALYYASCFTDEYQDVCKKQKIEDVRFKDGVTHLFQKENIACEMLRIYFEEVFRYKTADQIERIKKMLMAVNVHVAASSLTSAGFALAVACLVSMGMNLSLHISALVGRRAAGLVGIAGAYGIVQKAADSAHRLYYLSPTYYAALYAQELEMMYFLVEPLFERASAFKQSASDVGIADTITRMIR